MLVYAIAAGLVLFGQMPGARAHAGHHPMPVITDADQVDSHRRGQHRVTGHHHRASRRAAQRPAAPAKAAAAADPGHNNKLAPQMYEYLALGSTKPQGWLLAQSQIQADTLGGHLEYFFVNNR